MLTFMSAYLAVWLAVCVYMLRLNNEQRRLRQTAETLKDHLEKQRPPRQKAA
jgi:CcmD family protein